MRSSKILLAALSAGLGAAVPSAACSKLETRAAKFAYGSEKVRGVNLGGWLVLEPWITPSLFDQWAGDHSVKDEFSYTKALGKETASSRLDEHWSSWIKEQDLVDIAAAGLNHVRIPVGYWSVTPLPGDPYVSGAYKYLNSSLDWAQKHNLKVMIDLHGAPGSQNGYDNSGHAGAIDWPNGDNVQLTLDAINKIAKDFGSHPAVASIELINEPFGYSIPRSIIEKYYTDAIAEISSAPVYIGFHEAYFGVTNWNNFSAKSNNLILDTHNYEVFNITQLNQTIAEQVEAVCEYGGMMASTNKVTISGEWTAARTDCAKWLNGFGNLSRYAGHFDDSPLHGDCKGLDMGSVEALAPEEKTNIRMFTEAQIDAYEMAGGWFFWTWKTESAPEWNLQELIKSKLFPQPIDKDRQHPGQCKRSYKARL